MTFLWIYERNNFREFRENLEAGINFFKNFKAKIIFIFHSRIFCLILSIFSTFVIDVLFVWKMTGLSEAVKIEMLRLITFDILTIFKTIALKLIFVLKIIVIYACLYYFFIVISYFIVVFGCFKYFFINLTQK